jgi:hypothetical protein
MADYAEGHEVCKDLDELIDESQDYADFIDGLIRRNVDYYLRRPRGDEQEGMSEFINSDVADVVDGFMPGLMDVFMDGDPCEFLARNAEDVEYAQQATIVANFVFAERNNRYVVLHNSIKNGLLKKAGFVTWRWDKSETVSFRDYKGLTAAEFANAQAMPGAAVESVKRTQVMALDERGMQSMVDNFECRIKTIKSDPRVCVENVPPEEILVHASARSPDIGELDFLCHKRDRTKAELLALGFDKEIVEEAMKHKGKTSSAGDNSSRYDSYSHDKTQRKNTIVLEHCFHRADKDGDGVAEITEYFKVGKFKLQEQVVDMIPFAAWTPKLLPDEFYGESPADDASDFQDLNTALMRNTLDSLYMSNSPRVKVMKGAGVNMDDLLDVRPGGVVRMDHLGAVDALVVPPLAQQTLPMIELADARREQRTGVTRYNQGLDGDSLNQTASGIKQITTLAQQKQKLIAMAYAELCLKRVFKGILHTLANNQSEQMIVRLTGKFLPISPEVFSRDYDCTINVGMGSATRDQRVMYLMQILKQQQEVMMNGGKDVLVNPTGIHNALTDVVKNAGFKDPARYWQDPAQAKPPAPPQPPLEMQLQDKMIAADAQKTQALMQQDAAKRGHELQVKQLELQIKDEQNKASVAGEWRIAQLKAHIEKMKLDYNEHGRSEEFTVRNMPLNQAEIAMDQMTAQMAEMMAQQGMMMQRMQEMNAIEMAEKIEKRPKQYRVQRGADGKIIAISQEG